MRLLACVLAFAIAAGLQSAVGPVFEIDAPYSLLATHRTLSTELPSTDIEGGGEVVRTTTRSTVERNYFGFVRQTYRRTDVELTGDRLALSGARKTNGSSSEVLVRRAWGTGVGAAAFVDRDRGCLFSDADPQRRIADARGIAR